MLSSFIPVFCIVILPSFVLYIIVNFIIIIIIIIIVGSHTLMMLRITFH